MTTITVKANQVSLGGFTGTLTSTVSSGFSMRTGSNDCKLISGDSLAKDGTLEDRSAFTAYVGYNPDNGNGGCNTYEVDPYGNTSTKTISRVNSNQDDGKLNFGNGDIFDAGNSLAIGFTGSNAQGVKINLSGLAYYNAALNLNDPAFRAFTSKMEDEFENQYKLGNAFIQAPLNDDVSITLGNYVQSQGTTALLPIGVNVVNPVSLPILRSPGAQLKDALLPQAMVGMRAFLSGGLAAEFYYQLEQKEVEIDVAHAFNGSDIVGRHSTTQLKNSPNYREDPLIPYGGNRHDAATCLSDGVTGACKDSQLWAGINASTGTGTPTANLESILYTQYAGYGAGGADLLRQGYNFARSTSYADLDAYITGALGTAAAAAGGLTTSVGAQQTGTTLTDAQINASLTTLGAQYAGINNTAALVAVNRAPDAHADDSGQYGFNLSGYLDDVGSGVEWGLYYNNSHSNSPRVRMLAIEDGYASTLYTLFATEDVSKDYTDTDVTTFEQIQSNIAYNDLLCGVVYKAGVGSAAAYGAFSNAANAGSEKAYLHDPEKCYATFDQLAGLAYQADQLKETPTYDSDPTVGLPAAKVATHAKATGAANGALATLGFTNGARYQVYYPEDIQTFGASVSTGLGGWATNAELTFRPDFPFQVSVPQLLLNIIDSSGGTVIQSLTSFATASTANQGAIAVANGVNLQKWSSQPNCDISSATGKTSIEMLGYATCDGTAEHDVWSLDLLGIKTYTASDPISKSSGADGGSLLLELGTIYMPDYDNAQGLVSTNHQAFGHDVYGGGCVDVAGTSSLAVQSNGLFGDGYCEDNSGPDTMSMTTRIRGSLNYFNFNNSPWTFSPSVGIDYDLLGNAPSSLGGWSEGEARVTLGTSFTNDGTTMKLNYVAELGDYEDNDSSDKDYLSASVTHSF
tara:strand:+ start:1864 stop:4605 length:2742 start_codon:yes stop_codon:yes gene_type:complete